MDVPNWIARYMPHGHCLKLPQGEPLAWFWLVGDGMTWLAYMSIPIALAIVNHNFKERIPRQQRQILWLFATFIFLCGTDHLVNMIDIWYALYIPQAGLKIAMGIVSIFTAYQVIIMLPAIFRHMSDPDKVKNLQEEIVALKRELAEGDV